MSDYMFMLESHLSAGQSRAMSYIQSVAAAAGVGVFLTGGALRDMLAGFPIQELDFTVEGDGIQIGKAVAAQSGADLVETADLRKSAKLRLAGGTRVTISMALEAKYPQTGGQPVLRPATIHEDLRSRDFTINAIAISLNAASRGLLMDPGNGVGDIERREIRAVTNYSLYDDPVRLLRLLRFKVRLGFTVADRTMTQYDNAREAVLESQIRPAALLEELGNIVQEQNFPEVISVLQEEKLLTLFSAELTAPKVNLPGLIKLQEARQMIPYAMDLHIDDFSIVLNVLTEKLTAAERSRMASHLGMSKDSADRWLKLSSRAKKLEVELKKTKLSKPSLLYKSLINAPGDEVLYLFLQSQERLVRERIRNYLQKYLAAAQEITDDDVAAAGVTPGSAKFEKAKADLIAAHLDAKPKKPTDQATKDASSTDVAFIPGEE